MTSRVGRTALVVVAVPLALTAVLAGCSSSGNSDARGSGSSTKTSTDKSAQTSAGNSADKDGGTAAADRLGTVASVECPGRAKAVPLPADGVPAPLPEGVVVVDVRGPADGRTVVTGVVPRGEQTVLGELQNVYPSAGFTLSQGETEARDAESNFAGNGVKGRWGIRELSDCSPVATRIDLVFTSTG